RRARARAVVERGEAWRGHDGIWFAPRGLVTEGGRVAVLFPGVEGAPAGLEEDGLDVIRTNRRVFHALGALGVRPDVFAGHSIGEWSGMIASGMVAEEAVDVLL